MSGVQGVIDMLLAFGLCCGAASQTKHSAVRTLLAYACGLTVLIIIVVMEMAGG